MVGPRTIAKMRAHGIVNPIWLAAAAKRAGLHLSLACALVEQESGGGHNVFGHDPSIFSGAGQVTKAKYVEYKRQRVASGNRKMQGVGPVQLTWWEFQDEADRRGGCWRPYANMLTGFLRLGALIAARGERGGVAAYNGSGAAAQQYASSVLGKRDRWHQILTK